MPWKTVKLRGLSDTVTPSRCQKRASETWAPKLLFLPTAAVVPEIQKKEQQQSSDSVGSPQQPRSAGTGRDCGPWELMASLVIRCGSS